MYQCTYYTNYTTMYVYHHVTRLFIYKLHWPSKWKCGVELITHSFTFNLKQWIVLSLRHLESETLNNIRTLLIDVNYIALTILNHNFVCFTQWRILLMFNIWYLWTRLHSGSSALWSYLENGKTCCGLRRRFGICVCSLLCSVLLSFTWGNLSHQKVVTNS